MSRRGRLWLPVAAWAALIFTLSSFGQPFPPDTRVPYLDKAGHAAVYAVLGFFLMRALAGDVTGWSRRRLLGAAAALALLYGISDEMHQAFVPGRDVSVWDALFDLIGGYAGAFYFGRRRE